MQVVDTNARRWEPQAMTNQTELSGLDLIRALTRKLRVVHKNDGTALIMVSSGTTRSHSAAAPVARTRAQP